EQLRISLPEMLEIARKCIHEKKSDGGFYGYPASLILLSVVDCIGSYVRGGSVENHFLILMDDRYFGVGINSDEVKRIYRIYRNRLSHNGILGFNAVMFVSQQNPHPYIILGEI